MYEPGTEARVLTLSAFRAVGAAGARRGLALEPLGRYATPGASHPPALVVGYGTTPDHAFAAALDLLCAVLF